MNQNEIVAELEAIAAKTQSLLAPISTLIQGMLPIPQDYQHRNDCKGQEMHVKCIGCFKGWMAEQKRFIAELTQQIESVSEKLSEQQTAYLALVCTTRELAELAQMAVNQINSKDEFNQFNLFTRRLQDKIDSMSSMCATEATDVLGEMTHQSEDQPSEGTCDQETVLPSTDELPTNNHSPASILNDTQKSTGRNSRNTKQKKAT